jgi:hypothetical protein
VVQVEDVVRVVAALDLAYVVTRTAEPIEHARRAVERMLATVAV